MMSECARTGLLLPIRDGLGPTTEELRRAKAHLTVCDPCRKEQAQILKVIELLTEAGGPDLRLPDAVRRRVAREAAREAERRPWFWVLPAPVFALSARSSVLAAAAFVLVALAALPAALRDGAGPVRDAGIESIQVRVEGPVVRLAWHNGEKGTYTVYKSTDPRSMSAGEMHVVRGHAWTDDEPATSPVIFYRVE